MLRITGFVKKDVLYKDSAGAPGGNEIILGSRRRKFPSSFKSEVDCVKVMSPPSLVALNDGG